MITKHEELTAQIIRASYTVYNKLGYGFLEKVYAEAMLIKFSKMGLAAVHEKAIHIYYDNQLIGEYSADLVVADKVIVELKAVKELAKEHHAQLLNYMKSTTFEVGLLLNFGPKPQIARKTFDNNRKGNLQWVS